MHLISPQGESLGGLFVGAVRGLLIMFERPPNSPIYTECIVTWVLQSFHTFNYFIPILLQGDTCLPRPRPLSDDVIWTFGSESPYNADYGVQQQPSSAWLLMTSAPIILSGYEIKIGS
jgi:hypothetical protein